MANLTKQLALELGIKDWQVENTVALIDEGNTIPFIARYRKERTGELDDTILRKLDERLKYLRNLENRKEEVIRLIDEQGKLTEELKAKIEVADVLNEVEDLYRPYKPKKRTKAIIAKEKGLEPLADILLAQDIYEGSIGDIANPFVNEEKGVGNSEEALQGAKDIIAEIISDNAEYRKLIRDITYNEGMIISKTLKPDEKSPYEMYYDFNEPVKKIAPHRILAINRGEKEEFLTVKIEAPVEQIMLRMYAAVLNKKESITTNYVKMAVDDGYKRLIAPSIEREIRSDLTDKGEEQAIKVFASNLHSLLMQSPVKGKVVLGFDPGFRTGCKIAVVDDTGKLLDTTTLYVTAPQNDIEGSRKKLKELILKHDVDIISLGNGTASRESEEVIAGLLPEIDKKIYYVIVSEAGASVYSASELAAKEYPDINVSLRGAISIARRLQDPLAELVKIDPKSIGVGQYQHDVTPKKLDESLGGVVEDAVNSVGVDLNTASPSLLQYVSGINSAVAKNIVEYREENGKFKSRKEILKVKRLGDKVYTQCAGFLRVPESKNVMDNTAVHPESYEVTEKLLKRLGYTLDDVKNKKMASIDSAVSLIGLNNLAQELDMGVPTLKDIISELKKPGRDPREDLPKPILMSGVIEITDLKPGMIMNGTVRNVADFGAFVDIGVHQDGLVHISQLADKFVKHPLDVVKVGDIVKVKIIDVDVDRKRISLTMKEI
ncbi:30S ribosomal protein S1 [Oxobacter pfennigii]|uniref:30S ribosomal protein S1 n=1 Tax=Oxobacter pfennigii TaxID=36849 RepID=A0A0P8WDY5_9CLOT|nr:Tex family protein [Oxobacter pfennigii]KPU46302.1 30S ribosomal protein S1 [Oxobacter pfennigii]